MALGAYYWTSRPSPAGNDLMSSLPGNVVCLNSRTRPEDELPALMEEAKAGRCRLFLECPASVPGLELAAEEVAGPQRTVATSDWFGSDLPIGRIVVQHQCYFRSVKNPGKTHLALARVAGYRRLAYPMPEKANPLLFFHPDSDNILISTTSFSNFARGRFAPFADWRLIAGRLLGFLAGSDRVLPVSVEAAVQPAYTEADALPEDAETAAFLRSADWFYAYMFHNTHGRHGVFEGYNAAIDPDGRQWLMPARRADCNGEAALVTALDHVLRDSPRGRDLTHFLLDNLFNGHGLIDGNPASQTYGSFFFDEHINAVYGGDNARAAMSALLAGELLEDDRHARAILRLMFSQLRTTGKNGLRRAALRHPASFTDGRAWRYYYEEDFRECRPHYQAHTWALYLQAYVLTGHGEFLDKAKRAIAMARESFPDFLWTNGIMQEWCRFLLPLAMLVEVEDTAEHRAWLAEAAAPVLEALTPSGILPERIGRLEDGRYPPPASHDAYGSNEASLIQENGDPACDLVYSMNFAFIGLHEAHMATKDARYGRAADLMASFFCRAQARSATQPYLDGCWLRGFDYELWDYYGSSADSGWGAWCVESGWTNTWIAATLGLRRLKRPLLCRGQAGRYRELLPEVRAEMMDHCCPSTTFRGLVVNVDASVALRTPGGDGD